jgi:hypothetical protein
MEFLRHQARASWQARSFTRVEIGVFILNKISWVDVRKDSVCTVAAPGNGVERVDGVIDVGMRTDEEKGKR